MAYTVILVDDEDEVRGRIASKIEGDSDFKVVGSASNGYDALDLLEEITPDVVITDIKMPFVDGIELTRTIKERYPTVQIAIISGYDDYSYLKEAINLDVVAFLSKPISIQNVKGFLGKIKARLEEVNEHIRMTDQVTTTRIRRRIMRRCFSQEDYLDYDQSKLDEIGFGLDKSYVVVSTELLDYPGGMIEVEQKKNQCYVIAEELINEVMTSFHVVMGKYIVCMIEVQGRQFKRELDNILYKVLNYLQKYASVDVVMGVSNQGKFEELGKLYRQSQSALESYEIANQTSINYFQNLNIPSWNKMLTAEEINEFKKNIRYMKANEFLEYITDLTLKLKSDQSYDYFNVMIALSGMILEYAGSIESDKNVALDVNSIKSFVEKRNIEGFMSYVVDIVSKMKADVMTSRSKKSVEIVGDIIDFIEKDFNNPEMNMDMVCDHFHISISYLSTLFKKETETTFNKYLVVKRIEHAKMLLRTTDDKMVTIAEKCGYKDVYYFSHSFKKVTGQTPKRFRANESI